MKVKVTEIEKRVISLLDENREVLEERTVYGDETAELGYLIRQLLPEAARAVLLSTPLEEIDETESMSGIVSFDTDGKGVFSLPTDFLRLVRFRMSDWERGVSVALDPTGDAYSLRCSGSLRGQRRRGPAVAIVHRNGGRVLEVFGSSAGATPVAATYLKVPEISGVSIALPSSVVSAVAEKTAEMVRAVVEN